MAVSIPLTTITTGYNLSKLNDNFVAIADALADGVSRSGNSPNTMSADLDMNNQQVINLSAPGGPNDAARLIDITALANAIGSATALTTTITDSSGYYPSSNVEGAFQDIGAGLSSLGVIATGSTTLRDLATRHIETFNVKDFGAEGDGSTDDTVAIQAAIDAAKVATGSPISPLIQVTGVVYFPPPSSSYFIASGNTLTLADGITLKGDSEYTTSLLHGGGSVPCMELHRVAAEFFSGVRIEGLTIAGDGAGTTRGIDLDHCIRNCYIKNVNVSNCGIGVYLEECWTFMIDTCQISKNITNNVRWKNATNGKLLNSRFDSPINEHSVYVSDTGGGGNSSLGLLVDSCAIQGSQKAGFYGEDLSTVTFLNNFFEDNNRAVGTTWGSLHLVDGDDNRGSTITIIGGHFTPGGSGNNTSRCIHVDRAQMVNLLGVHMRGSNFAVGVELGSNVDSCSIIGTNFNDVVVEFTSNSTGFVYKDVSSNSNGIDLYYRNLAPGGGPDIDLNRDSPTPAASDVLGRILFNGRDSSDDKKLYARILATITDPTAGSIDGKLELQTVVAGVVATAAFLGQGFVVGSPTGGDKGVGSVNATQVYEDGSSPPTDYVFDLAVDGSINSDKYDALVPNKKHEHARRFKEQNPTGSITADGLAQQWKTHRRFANMPEVGSKEAERLSIGKLTQRLLENSEVQAVVMEELNQKIKVLEGLVN